ncbi:conjugal transfer protein TraG N-terminal domain-containing protein [Acidithiobacillus thiooxidans]|uniref:conjugal transfer protein TraG N-terminal domain-containing protein n=1 Tax=Acidithiobacillus thiooxidans TaxID=930 RepID=UPI0004E1591F|nr:conjugal transfer protein TraG N-terminal domain-containing protein [Acidithiobacillus thiooxidans]
MNFKLIKRLLGAFGLLLPLLFWASPAFAGGVLNPGGGNNAWELYVFGNGAVIYSILNSVSAMVNDPGYHTLLEFVGVLGIFGTAIMVGFDASKMPKMLAFVLGAFFVLYVSLDVTANIMVEDPINNYTNVATGVPAVVGVPAAVISDVGHWLTSKVEQDFSLPNSLTVTGGDQFNLANSLMQSATQAQILDPYLKSSFAAYISNCVMPELANGTLNAETILTSTDFLNAIQVNNQAILTPYYSSAWPNGQLVDCTGAWTDISGTLNNEASSLLTANTSQWGGNGVSIISSGLTSATAWLSNNTANQSADQTILQTATLNMFNGTAMQEGAALTGNNGLLTSMAVAQAEQSQESSWYTGAQVFNNLMGYIYSVLQAFLFAITPLLMAATLIPGFGFAVLKNFFQVLLWLILWQPMLAIVSYIVALYGQSSYGGVLASSGGITDLNLPVISQQSSHMVLAAGFLATMVPIIAWGLVKGSLAFSDFIMAAGGGALASSAGAQAATGNVSLDNQSMNNDAFNSKNFSHSVATGEASMVLNQGAFNSLTKEDFGGFAQAMNGSSLMQNNTVKSSTSAGTNASNSGTLGSSAGVTSQVAAGLEHALSQNTANGYKLGVTAGNGLNAAQNYQIGQKVGQRLANEVSGSQSEDTSKDISASMTQGLSVGLSALGAAGLFEELRGTAAAGRDALSMIQDGKSTDAEIAQKTGLSEDKVAALRAKSQELKQPGFLSRAKGYIQTYAKEAAAKFKNAPAAEKIALAAGGALLLAVGAVTGVDEAAAVVGFGAGGAEAAEGATAITEALPEAEEAVEGGADGADSAAGDSPADAPSEPAETADKPEEESNKPNEPKKGKGGRPPKRDKSLLEHAFSAVPGNANSSANFKENEGAAVKSNLTRKGNLTNDSGSDASNSQNTTKSREFRTAVSTELQALSTMGTKYSRQISQNLSRGATIQRQLSEAEVASRSQSVDRSITYATSDRVSSNEATQLNTGTPVTNIPKAQQRVHEVARQRLNEAQQGTAGGPGYTPVSSIMGKTGSVTPEANGAATSAQQHTAGIGSGKWNATLAKLKNKEQAYQQRAQGQASATKADTQNAEALGRFKAEAGIGDIREAGAKFRAMHQDLNKTTLPELLAKSTYAMMPNGQLPMQLQGDVNQSVSGNRTMMAGRAEIFNRMFAGPGGQQRLKDLMYAAEENHVPVNILAGILATESSGESGTALGVQHFANGTEVVGSSQDKLYPEEMKNNPNLAHDLETSTLDSDMTGAAVLAAKLKASNGNMAQALAKYSGSQAGYATRVADFAEYFDEQTKSLNN